MASRKIIEKRWVNNLKKSVLIEQSTGVFNVELAYQIFYGAREPQFPKHLPNNYNHQLRDFKNTEIETVLSIVLNFLYTIGIKLNRQLLTDYILSKPADLEVLVRKTHYILKYLAHAKNIDLDRPYKDNFGDINFLLMIESGEIQSGFQTTIFDEGPPPEIHRKNFKIPDDYEKNEEAMNLFKSIENTNSHFYITGKAGTGKSTFIHYFIQKTKKNAMVFAYTGLAALNAGGQTIHSFFLFPLRPLLPFDEDIPKFLEGTRRYEAIKNVETIVIDEVSMLRSDILEAIDFSLRFGGGNPKLPFGGKQIVFVGDIFQIPPIVRDNDIVDQVLFQEIFPSQYFFHAPAFANNKINFVELTRVHRQKDPEFIRLLDEVRLCNVSDRSLMKLNANVNSEFTPPKDKFFIKLATKNNIVEAENLKKLKELPFTEYSFIAKIDGDFDKKRYPTSEVLILKKFAQIMLVRNDKEGRWVNGTIAKIDFVADDHIEIMLQNGEIYPLQKEKWDNIKYSYNKNLKKIVSQVVGTFEQFPIKLGWAITIHKSQGLTFDNVIIDLGTGAFVNGQVYTALSRCRTLDGMILQKPIHREDIITDMRVIDFHNKINN
jgi:ATP-dependent DNA helicase PIF1